VKCSPCEWVVPNYKCPNTPFISQGSRRSWLVNKDFFASVLETASCWFQLKTKVLSNVGDWDCCVGNVYRTGTRTQGAMPFRCRLIRFESTDSKRPSRSSSRYIDGAKNKSNNYSPHPVPFYSRKKFYFKTLSKLRYQKLIRFLTNLADIQW
jgi:hypothetical protein